MGVNYVPRDAPVGSVIGRTNVQNSYHHAPAFNCGTNDGWEFQTFLPKVAAPPSMAPIPGMAMDKVVVLKTNVPGVGLIVTATQFNNKPEFFADVSGQKPYVPFKMKYVKGGTLDWAITTNFTLIKISSDMQAGSFDLKGDNAAVALKSGAKTFHKVYVKGSVVRSECTVAGGGNAYIEVPMGEVMRREFNGKDSHMDSKDVVIPLTNCTAGTYPTDQGWNFYQNSNAHLRLDGVQGSAILDAGRGILGLTSDSTAKGVAVQVLRKDGVTPLVLGQEVFIAPVTDGSMNIELKSRYIQTSDSPSGPEPGKANARASFTVTYK